MLDLIGLADIADSDVSTIPTGTARVVELGRALMIQPRVLLLDEPASGQSDEETKAFEALLRRLVRDDGLSILLVEHDMALVMEVCDRIHVLDFGEVIAVGTPGGGAHRSACARRVPRDVDVMSETAALRHGDRIGARRPRARAARRERGVRHDHGPARCRPRDSVRQPGRVARSERGREVDDAARHRRPACR